jgi:hypothetical protein
MGQCLSSGINMLRAFYLSIRDSNCPRQKGCSSQRREISSALACSLHQVTCKLRALASLHHGRATRPANLNRHALVSCTFMGSVLFLLFSNRCARKGFRDSRNQYSMKSFLTVPVVPSAMISKNEAHSPQLNPSASSEVLCCGLVRFEVASRAIRASASCCTVISGVLKKEAVSFQTVSLNGRGFAKKRSERLQVMYSLAGRL